MATAAIGQTNSATPSQANISQEDFLRILTTQLSFQDPLKPMDNQQFMAQMAQFAALEQTRQGNENTAALLQTQAVAQSIGLLGKTVEVQTSAGIAVGEVITVRFANGSPLISMRTSTGAYLADLGLDSVSVVSLDDSATGP